MNSRIFRAKTMERVSSAEELNDYIRVANPGVWMVLLAVLLLLVGAFIWGIFGRMQTRIPAGGIAENGKITFFVRESDAGLISEGMTAEVQGREIVISEVSPHLINVTEEFGERMLHVGQLDIGEWVRPVTADADLPDGVYEGRIVTEEISPLYFVLN